VPQRQKPFAGVSCFASAAETLKREAGVERDAISRLTRGLQEPFRPKPQIAAWTYTPVQDNAGEASNFNYTVSTAAPSIAYNAAQIGS